MAAVAAAGVLASRDEAHAANGQNVIIGQSNNGTLTTSLSGSTVQVSNGNGGAAVRAIQNTVDGTAVVASTNSAGASAITGSSLNASGSWGVYGSSSGTDAILGETLKVGAAGVKGWANNGEGVRGEVNAGVGVHGRSPNGPGVMGESTGGTQPGVFGESSGTGAGVSGVGDLGPGVYAYSASGPALLLQSDTSIPPAIGTWQAGSVVFNDGLWLCLVGGVGPASKWVKLSRAFVPLDAPVRVYDSRPGYQPAVGPKTPLLDGQERDITATTGGAVPAGLASAVSVNLTVTNTGPAGFVSLYKNGIAWPGNSSINWTAPGSTVANGTIVALDTAGIFTARPKSTSDVVIDVLGYYT